MKITPTVSPDGSKLILKYEGDASKMLDYCAAVAREDREKRQGDKMPNKRRRMSVPRELMYKVAHEHGIPYTDTAAIWKILEGRDYSKFRTLDSGKPYRESRRSPVISIKR